jgi:hypothetical protein
VASQIEGVEEAQRRIEAAVLSGGRTLSLAGLGLGSVPASVTAAHELQEFDLSGNQLTELPRGSANSPRCGCWTCPTICCPNCPTG